MKKLGFILVAIVAIVVGLLVGTLNSSPVQLDLLWVQFELPLGLAILLGFSLGVMMGCECIYFARVLPFGSSCVRHALRWPKQDSTDLIPPDD